MPPIPPKPPVSIDPGQDQTSEQWKSSLQASFDPLGYQVPEIVKIVQIEAPEPSDLGRIPTNIPWELHLPGKECEAAASKRFKRIRQIVGTAIPFSLCPSPNASQFPKRYSLNLIFSGEPVSISD